MTQTNTPSVGPANNVVVPPYPQLKNVLVLGSGWSALGILPFLVQRNQVLWVPHFGSPGLPVFPSLDAESGDSLKVFFKLAEEYRKIGSNFPIDQDSQESGRFIRFFRNKAFSQAPWSQQDSREVYEDQLTPEEKNWIPFRELKIQHSLEEIQNAWKQFLSDHSSIQVSDSSIRSIDSDVNGFSVAFKNGKDLTFDQIFCGYPAGASRSDLEVLRGVEGVDRINLAGTSAIQVIFKHRQSLGFESHETFCAVPYRDPGESTDRRFWGYFTDSGNQSVWTVFLRGHENEDNHRIVRKVKKLKQTLGRMFDETIGNPFVETISSESIRLMDSLYFPHQKVADFPVRPQENFFFFADQFGVSGAMEQVERWRDSLEELEPQVPIHR